MQFRRNRPGGRTSSASLLRVGSPAALSLASAAALILAALLLRDNGYYQQDYQPTTTTTNAAGGVDTPPAVRSSTRVGSRKTAASAEKKVNLPLPCPAVRLPASSTAPLDETKIAILTDWQVPEGWSDPAAFASSFGRHGQYVKGNDVQPFTDGRTGERCKTSTAGLVGTMSILNKHGKESKGKEVLFFTNDVENPSFLSDLSSHYSVPPSASSLPTFANSSTSFRVFSAMEAGSSHPLHAHDAAWLGQVSGSRLWYFLPPDTPRTKWGPKVNACEYGKEGSEAVLPEGTVSCVQRAGEVVYFPRGWVHATCALEGWSVGIGGQGGSPAAYDQNFEVLGPVNEEEYDSGDRVGEEMRKMVDCGVLDEEDVAERLEKTAVVDAPNPQAKATPRQSDQVKADDGKVETPKNPPKDGSATKDGSSDWRWFDGDLNEYYNSLERDEHGKRDPDVITSYAVHRWLGPEASTLVHYELVRGEVYGRVLGRTLGNEGESSGVGLRVFDAG